MESLAALETVAESPAALVLQVAIAVVLVAAIVLGRRINASVGRIHFEMRPNGGSSLRDAINRIEAAARTVEERVERIEEFVEDMKRRHTADQ